MVLAAQPVSESLEEKKSDYMVSWLKEKLN